MSCLLINSRFYARKLRFMALLMCRRIPKIAALNPTIYPPTDDLVYTYPLSDCLSFS